VRTSRVQGAAGFTLVELLVVVTLLVVVLGVAVPAFRNMLDASERSLAENSLRVGVQVARDLAFQGEGDAGLVFIRDPDGRTRLVPVVSVGTYRDPSFNPVPFGPGAFANPIQFGVEREVFAPVSQTSPILLPRGYAVAGFADPQTIDQCFQFCPSTRPIDYEGWYDSQAYGNEGSPQGESARLDGNWLLPETFLYEPRMQAPGSEGSLITGASRTRTPRQSFMIRFESGTGQLVRGSRPAIVIDPRPSALGRDMFLGATRWMRADRIEDARDWASRVLASDDVDGNGVVQSNDRWLKAVAIGNFSNDTVLAGPVARLAMFRESDLVSGLGASGVNKDTNSLYFPIVTETTGLVQAIGTAGSIRFDLGLFDGDVISTPNEVRIGINRWIQGDTNFIAAGGFDRSDADGDGNIFGDAASGDIPADEPRAKLYFVQPATGDLTEVLR